MLGTGVQFQLAALSLPLTSLAEDGSTGLHVAQGERLSYPSVEACVSSVTSKYYASVYEPGCSLNFEYKLSTS